MGDSLKSFAAIGLALAGFVLDRMATPTASLAFQPSNPAALTAVQFTDTSLGSPTSWKWDFGDGQTDSSAAPAHVYSAAGVYLVSLTAGNAGGHSTSTATVIVSDENTLRLVGTHSFDVTLEARDPRTGNTASGKAIPQNDLFGYFTIPSLVPTPPGAPLVPEVLVKILDATSIGQNYWVFWGGLTDLDYTLTVKENDTGLVKQYHNLATGSPACLGADTSGFGSSATLTPTSASATSSPTRTRTTTPSPTSGSVTRFPTKTHTATPRAPVLTPTPTRTPTAAPIDVQLRALSWQWDFTAGPEISRDLTWPGQNEITLHVGQTYRFDVYNGNPDLDPPLAPHTFSGVSGIGLSGGQIASGMHLPPRTITITSGMVGSYEYLCTDSTCGASNQHDRMHGRILVVN